MCIGTSAWGVGSPDPPLPTYLTTILSGDPCRGSHRMMVWISEGTNVVCKSPPPQRSIVSLTLHERLAQGKGWKVLHVCRGQDLTRDGTPAAKCKPFKGVCAKVHKTWLARDEVLGTSCAHPLILLLWATRLEKRVGKLPQNPPGQNFSPRVDWKETPPFATPP